MSITDYNKLITLQTKEHNGNGYFPTEITTSFCDSPLCAEVHETGIIYRDGPRFSPLHPPAYRINDPSGINNISYGHVSPCSLKITINSIEQSPNTNFYTYVDYSQLERDFYGFNYNINNNNYDNNTNIDRLYTQKKWLIPMTSGSFSSIPIHYGIAGLEFDRSSSFTFTNGYSRNVYMYLDLYLDSDIYNGRTYISNTFRKLVGTITYGVTSGNIHQDYIYNNDIDQTYYNSTVNCTGWQNVKFDEVIFASGNIFDESTCDISFSSHNNVLDNYNFAENISEYSSACSGATITNSIIRDYYPKDIVHHMLYTHVTHPLQLDIVINNVSGYSADNINGHHVLTIDNVESTNFAINDDPAYTLPFLSKRFDHFNIHHSGKYDIIDPNSKRFDNTNITPLNNAHITHICIFSTDHVHLTFPSSGDFFIGLFSIYKYKHDTITYPEFSNIGNFYTYNYSKNLYELNSFNPYEYVKDNSSSDHDVIAIYSGHYTYVDTKNGHINNNIRCELVSTHRDSARFNPVVSFSGSYIDILPNSNYMTRPVTRDLYKSDYGGYQTGYESSIGFPAYRVGSDRSICVPNSAPVGVLVDCSNLILSNGLHVKTNVKEPTYDIAYYRTMCWNAGLGRNKYVTSTSPFSCNFWTGSDFVTRNAIPVNTSCSGCSTSSCHTEPDYYPNGVYYLRPGYIDDQGINSCNKDLCVIGHKYYYINPNRQSSCDWLAMDLSYTLNYIELNIIYSAASGDYNCSPNSICAGSQISFRTSTTPTFGSNTFNYSGILDCNQSKTLSVYDPTQVHTSPTIRCSNENESVSFGDYGYQWSLHSATSFNLDPFLPCGATFHLEDIDNYYLDKEAVIDVDSKYHAAISGIILAYQHPRYMSGDITITPIVN